MFVPFTGVHRHHDVRPVSQSVGRMFVKMGFLFLAMALAMLAFGILAILDLVGGMDFAKGCLFVVLGGPGAVGAVFLSWWASRELRTVVRFSLAGDQVVVEWRRGDVVVKTERVWRADVVEVTVTDAPSSGVREYGLVVGMRNGEIDLTRVSITGSAPPRPLRRRV